MLYLSGEKWLTIRHKIHEDFESFKHWGELNDLHVNVKKTKVIILVGARSH